MRRQALTVAAIAAAGVAGLFGGGQLADRPGDAGFRIPIPIEAESDVGYNRSEWGSFRVNVDRDLRWREADCKWGFYASGPENCLGDGRANNRDHMVPVADAHRSGGHAWDRGEKRDFYSWSANLFVLSAAENRLKSDKGPEEWKPVDESVWCEYALVWIETKLRWDLSADRAEADALVSMLEGCER